MKNCTFLLSQVFSKKITEKSCFSTENQFKISDFLIWKVKPAENRNFDIWKSSNCDFGGKKSKNLEMTPFWIKFPFKKSNSNHSNNDQYSTSSGKSYSTSNRSKFWNFPKLVYQVTLTNKLP